MFPTNEAPHYTSRITRKTALAKTLTGNCQRFTREQPTILRYSVTANSPIPPPTAESTLQFQGRCQNLNPIREGLGAAVAVGGKLVTIDVFDKPTTCGRVWNRLLSGTILDALEVKQTDKQAEAADVERALTGLRNLSWEPAEPIGEGEEYRAESPTGDHASALLFDGTVVHGSVVCAT